MHNIVGHYGWSWQGEASKQPTPKLDWNALQESVSTHIRTLNFGYTVQLRTKAVKYLNAYAKFVDPHTLECTDRRGDKSRITARRVLIATRRKAQDSGD